MCHCPTCSPPENGIDPDPRAQEMMLEQHGCQADAQCFVRRCCKGDVLSFWLVQAIVFIHWLFNVSPTFTSVPRYDSYELQFLSKQSPQKRKEDALLHWILFIYPFEIKIATGILRVRSSKTIGLPIVSVMAYRRRSLRWIAEAESGRAAFFCNSMSSVWWKPRWYGFYGMMGQWGCRITWVIWFYSLVFFNQ